MTALQEWITEIQSDVADGASVDDSVRKLHANGISVINSIRIIRNSYQIPLSKAKSWPWSSHTAGYSTPPEPYTRLLDAVFDLYRIPLHQALNRPLPDSPEKERETGVQLTRYLLRGL